MPVINFSEAELEQHFCENVRSEFDCRLIGSQIKLDCGVLDVLMRAVNGNYFVVELKKGNLDNDALAQVLAYTTELRARHTDRTFIPVLCGAGINGKYLHHCLDEFCADIRPITAALIMFGWDMNNGLSFSWHMENQREAEERRSAHTSHTDTKLYYRSSSVGGPLYAVR